MADETTQGVHPFTLAWWRSLPGCYRAADRVQGYRLEDAWHGLNRDPRFFTGFDSWSRTNTSTKAWEASVAFTRTFRVTPHVPVHLRSWHAPQLRLADGTDIVHLDGTRVRHIIRNHTGQIIASEMPMDGTSAWDEILDGGQVLTFDDDTFDGGTPATPGDEVFPEALETADGRLIHHTVVLPDRFGIIHVTVQVFIDVTDLDLADGVHEGPFNVMEAIHVGHQDTTFADLPDADYYRMAAAYPLLRYMDGIGHQGGYLSDAANDMHSGAWSDPYTAPDYALPFLAAVLGLPARYAQRLTPAELRSHLVALVSGDAPAAGSRNHLAITAQEWLSGSRQVSVVPAHMVASFRTPVERDLVEAMGYTGRVRRVHVAREAPVPEVSYRWSGTARDSISERLENGVVVHRNHVRNSGVDTTNYFETRSNWSWVHDATVGRTRPGSARVTRDGAYGYLVGDFMYKGAGAEQWSGSAWVYCAADTVVQARMFAYTGGPGDVADSSGESASGPVVEVPANTWTEVPVTAELTGVTTRMRLGVQNPAEPAYTASDLWVDDLAAAPAAEWYGTYFDGATPDSTVHDIWVGPDVLVQDLEHRWSGTPGASTSERVVNGTVTHLNYVPNPGVGLDGHHATSPEWSWVRDPGRGRTTAGSARITRDGSNGHLVTPLLPADPGEKTWHGSVWVFSEADTVAAARFYAYADPGDGTYPATEETATGPVVEVPAGIWTQLPITATFTDGTRQLRLAVYNSDTDVYAAGDLWADDFAAAPDAQWYGEFFDGDTADSGTYENWLVSSPSFTAHTWGSTDGITDEWLAHTGDVDAAVAAVVTERVGGDRTRLHTLIIRVRADEVPNNDLDAFAAFLNDSGVVPAGHVIVPEEATQTWDQYQTGMGNTWADHDAASPTWNAHDSAGITLDYTQGA